MAASSQSMDQEMAQRLFHDGGTLVLTDMPPGTEFGIDYNSWRVGDRFRGVKMIPPGVHFIYYSAVGKDGDVAPRTGFFHVFHQGELLVKKWDNQTEDLKTGSVSAQEQQQFEDNKRDLDRHLGAYPYDSYKKWVSFTCHVTPGLVARLQPQSGRILAVTPLISEGSTTESRKEAAASSPGGDTGLPDMKEVPGTTIRFTDLPRRTYPEGATPAQVTKYSMDHSHILRTILGPVTSDLGPVTSDLVPATSDLVPATSDLGPVTSDLLGEIQFSFICFLIGQVYDGFEQWKKLVNLLSSCEEAVAENSELFSNFITVLYHQIQEIPQDFFVDIISQSNFLTITLRSFFANLRDSDCENKLKLKGLKFQEHLERKFNWDFGAEDEEDEPVLVV